MWRPVGITQLAVPDESPLRERPEEEKVPLRLGALDKVSLEADERTELEREKQVTTVLSTSKVPAVKLIEFLAANVVSSLQPSRS